MGTITEAREEFSHDLYATKLSGAEIDEIGENFARCSMKLTENHRLELFWIIKLLRVCQAF